ncbi:MAG: LAGLIDADG family homing endonuclease [Candidatus Aenigmarchaeota archaeon]
MELNEKMAEFFGILVGDGNLFYSKKHRFYRVKISGDSETDLAYHKYYVIPLIKNLFNLEPKMAFHKDFREVDSYFYSKEIVSKLKKKFNFPERKSDYSAKHIHILLKNDMLKASFLRGFFDTDGTIYKKYGNYAQIGFRNHNFDILNEIFLILKSMGLNPSFNRHGSVCIHRQKEIKEFFKLVGSSNPKHIVRYLKWKNTGKVPPIQETMRLMNDYDFELPYLDKSF